MQTLKTLSTFVTALLLMSILSASSCNRDNDGPSVNPTISFVTDSGYTYQNDTVPLSDTLRVGVMIRKGSENIPIFKVRSAYDQMAAMTVDSLPLGTDSFEFEKQILIRNVAGTETWTFQVVEGDGDIIQRKLTFVVQ